MTKTYLRRITVAIAILTISTHINSQSLKELDSIATSLTSNYGLKGIALVGVKGDSVIYKKGFGKANEVAGITGTTPLYIASNTKAFIGLAVARLIEQKKLSLEDPMIEYIDRSNFPSELELNTISIRDLLSHSHGLSNDPLTFRTSSSGEYPEKLQELLKFTRYYPEGDSLVKNHRYSNFGYLLLGMIIEEVTGSNWKEYIENAVLNPMQLGNTSAYVPKGASADAMALPYKFSEDKPLKQVKRDNTLHAAGGLYSTLDDMAKWLGYFTDPESERSNVFPDQLEHYPDSLVTIDKNLGPININGYGYGWYQGNLFGKEFYFHTGGFSGHASFMSFMPEEGLGFFVYTNENTNLYRSVLHIVLMYYAILTESPAKKQIDKMMNEMTRNAYENYSEPILDPIRPVNKLLPTGTFIHEAYGTLSIARKGDHYEIYFGKNLSSIAFNGDTPNEFVTEFIPGSLEHFFVENENQSLRIKYDEFEGYFYPVN